MYLELLSPARNLEIGIAAIDSGADAVYIGGPFFGARKDAGNSVEDIAALCDYAHKFGARVFVTFNISVSEDELPEMHRMMLACQDAGADAFIVRDERIFGWKDITVPLHASTQCAIRTVEDALRYEALGAGRLVLERELSLDDIRAIRAAVKCELEFFVHGALCVCYSGDCRLSEYLDGRSADRGECIQVCRRSYTATDNETGYQLDIDNKYIMSPKDLKTIRFIDRMMKSGVRVFKIEGRARGPEYVYTVVRCYREAIQAVIDGEFTEEKKDEWDERLSTVFNRGFWDGYYQGQLMGEWNKHYGSNATERKVYIGKGVKYFSKLGVAEFTVEANTFKRGDKMLITGPTTGVMYVSADEIHGDNGPIEVAEKGTRVSIAVTDKIRPSDKLFKLEPVNQE